MVRTAPWIRPRLLVYFGVGAALILMTGAGAGIWHGIAQLGQDGLAATSTFWTGSAGFAVTAGVILFLRDCILCLVKAGLIAVLVELLHRREIPRGQGQIADSRGIVTQRFGQASVLFALDQLSGRWSPW